MRLFIVIITALLLGCTPPENYRAAPNFVINYAVKFKGSGEKFTLIALVPSTIEQRQTVNHLTYSPAPTRTFMENGNLYVEWNLSPVAIKEINFTLTAAIELAPPIISPTEIAARRPDALTNSAPPLWAAQFLQAENKIESEAPLIREMANNIDGTKPPRVVAMEIFTLLITKLKYRGFVSPDNGAAAAAQTLRGDCTDFTDLFVALCRAKKIPARHVSGWFIDAQKIPGHSWAEFYDGNNWVPVDVLHGKLGSKLNFGVAPQRYIYLSHLRNDATLGGGMLYWWHTQPRSLSAAVKVTVKKSP